MHPSNHHNANILPFIDRPQTKLREGYVFTGVCDSVQGGVHGGACMEGCAWRGACIAVGHV